MPAAPAAPPAAAPSAPAPAPAAPAAPAPAKAPEGYNIDKAFERMDSFTDKPKAPSKAAPPAKPEPVKEPEIKAPDIDLDIDDEAEPTEQPKEETPPEPPPTDKKGKVSPWKLVDHYKNEISRYQKEIAEIKSKPPEDPEKKVVTEKLSAIEKRNQELEDEIRYVNYSKSQEFVEKYQKPYEQAWSKAISDLKELTIEGDEGQSRQATVQDLLTLTNMSLGEARKMAKQWFGDSADDIMAHRRAIRDLSEAQNKALEEAKTKAGEREKQRMEQWQAQSKAMQEETVKLWGQFNKEAQDKYEFLKPVDGQNDRNAKLTKATEFVDKAFAENISDPRLNPQQRAEIIKRHAAVRNRAIGYSVLLYENKALKAQLAEKETALKAYQGSEPTKGDGKGQVKTTPTDPMEASLQSLRKYAS